MQQRVKQHGAVAVGEHEAVTVGPLRIVWVVLKKAAPEHFGNICHAHGRARMTRVGLLYSIHAQRTDGVGKLTGTGNSGHRTLLVAQAQGGMKWGAIVLRSEEHTSE